MAAVFCCPGDHPNLCDSGTGTVDTYIPASTSSHSFCRGLQICSFPYFVCRTLHYAVALLKRSYNANEIPFARTFLDIHPLGKAVLVADNKGALGE